MEQWIIVRDKKPEIPWWNPDRATRIADNWQEHNICLRNKIDEEIKELQKAHKDCNRDSILEECADIYEVGLCMHYSRLGLCMRYPTVKQIVSQYDITEEDIFTKAKEKRETHWSFNDWILLDLTTVLLDKK